MAAELAAPASVAAADRLSWPIRLAYALPGIPLQIIHTTTLGILPAFYARNTAAALSAIGLALMASRIIDALWDVLLGYLSDRTIEAFGGRKPWIIAGTAMAMVSVYFLFVPPPDAGSGYFAFWSLMAYIAKSTMEIPHRAWGADLSRDYRERSRIFSSLAQTTLIGAILFLIVPLLPIFESSDVMRPEIMKFVAGAMLIVLPLCTAVAVLLVPPGNPIATERATLSGLVKSVAGNRPLWHFALVFALTGIGIGAYNAAHLLYLATYLGLGDKFSYAGLVYYLVALPMASVWEWLMVRIGKHRAVALGLGTFALCLPAYALVPPGPSALPFILAFNVIFAMSASVMYAGPPAILGDIVDYDTLKTGANRGGNYYAFYQLSQKFEIALGGGLGFLLMGWFGFNAKGGNDELGVLGLQTVFLIIPSVAYLIATALVWRTPIDRRRQAVIRRRLESLAKRRGQAVGA